MTGSNLNEIVANGATLRRISSIFRSFNLFEADILHLLYALDSLLLSLEASSDPLLEGGPEADDVGEVVCAKYSRLSNENLTMRGVDWMAIEDEMF